MGILRVWTVSYTHLEEFNFIIVKDVWQYIKGEVIARVFGFLYDKSSASKCLDFNEWCPEIISLFDDNSIIIDSVILNITYVLFSLIVQLNQWPSIEL